MSFNSYLTGYLQEHGRINAVVASEIAEQFEERHFQKGQLFLKEGLISNEYIVLEEGFMCAYSFDTDGDEITTAFFDGRLPVFEVASFFQRIPSRENIQALTDCKGWVITYERLNMLFHALPEFRDFGRGILVRCFAAFKTRALSMITETAEQRYLSLLQSNPLVFQHAPLKQIASYLGITDSSLSRIRKEFVKK